jgi:hypothetical protein
MIFAESRRKIRGRAGTALIGQLKALSPVRA